LDAAAEARCAAADLDTEADLDALEDALAAAEAATDEACAAELAREAEACAAREEETEASAAEAEDALALQDGEREGSVASLHRLGVRPPVCCCFRKAD